MDNDYYEFIDDNVNINSMFNDSLSPQQEHDGQKIKANLKNTYIKKISSLLHNKNISVQQSPEEKNQQEKVLPNDGGQNIQYGEQYRLVKNRESAKNSRKRKKMYVELLENKVHEHFAIQVSQLTEKHENLKKICVDNYDLTEQLRYKMAQKQGEANQKILLITNLQNLVLSYAPEYEIRRKLDQINDKYGPLSQDRLTKVRHFFQEILENGLPDYVQYLMKISKNNKDIFAPKGVQEVDLMNLQNLKLSEKQKQIMLKQQQKLSTLFDEYQKTLYDLKDSQGMIIQELTQFDTTLSQLGFDLQPSQMAKFVLDIEKQDLQNYFKVSFNEYFGHKKEDLSTETPLEIYDFIREYQMNDSLDIEAHACFNLYLKSQEFIKSRKMNGIDQIQKIMDEN